MHALADAAEVPVREAGPADAVDGVRPALVATPGSVAEVSRVLAAAGRAGWRVAPRGGGSKLRLGNPPARLDLVLDLSRLDRVVEHAAGDLVVAVEAGVRLDALQARLAAAGQTLALDPPGPGATVGGVIAAGASGPRRFRYGTVRDLLIGVTVVLADGTVARAGGRVVKNVAGYDLMKLMAGSLGTLAVVVGAVFRLHPLPPAARLVEAVPAGAEEVERLVQRLLHSPLVPSAVELDWPADGAPRVGVLFEGVEPSVAAQAAAAAALVGPGAAPAVGEGEEAAARWRGLVPGPAPAGAVDLRVTCLPARLAATLRAAREAAARHGGGWRLSGSIGSGVLRLRLDDPDPAAVAALLADLRARVRPGSVVVLAAPPEVKRAVEAWGPVGDSLALMRRVKDAFDPDHHLNPGRFVGGV